ncbi:MAG: molybdopterin molybdotransferase MoeA [Negativicutes bacterium]|nr:molybdopterin molybdotransferase MoeA [Negativicutes bacterium]
MEFFQYLPLEKARVLIGESLAGIASAVETVELPEALGRVTAEAVIAGESLPPFDRSTVDGFAVRSADTFGASESVPALFGVAGEVAMGEQTALALRSGQAVSIPTGGMLPAGADAVVMLEYTEQPDAGTMLVARTVAPGENVVSRGEDIQAGAVIVEQGQRIASQHIGVLAACGYGHIQVRMKIDVAVISSGDELVAIVETPQPGQIRDINSHTVGSMLTEAGCRVKNMGIVKDSYADFHATLAQAVATSQLVIISGGSSVGARDYTVKAIDSLGTPGVLIHGIAVKPGRPTVFGLIGKVPVFGLPGHPVAAMTVCEQLVKPAVRLLLCQKEPYAGFGILACLARNVASTPGRDDFIAVQLSKQAGGYVADPLLGKSGLISVMAKADAVMHIPADKSGLYEGEIVEVMLLRSHE